MNWNQQISLKNGKTWRNVIQNIGNYDRNAYAYFSNASFSLEERTMQSRNGHKTGEEIDIAQLTATKNATPTHTSRHAWFAIEERTMQSQKSNKAWQKSMSQILLS